ncbi:ATP-binding protein [Alloscardovia venturai]|uniref:ATP-binding protein n=1 Tax=Alloscardovia venturai TaxID=1769421 RepID=A0ABW2Y571_9BIFI
MNQLIRQIIQDFDLSLYKPILPRELNLETPLTPRAGNLATVIMGIRRSGKTYRLFQEMQSLLDSGIDSSRILYFNFEDDRLAPITTQTGDDVLHEFFEVNPASQRDGCYIFFDEIQEMSHWDIWLRRIIDTTKATIYVTGSSSKLLSEEIATAFRGRSLAYEMTPFSFREFVLYHQPQLLTQTRNPQDWSSTDKNLAKNLFNDYLTRGGFPAIQDVSSERLILTLQGYAQRVVAKDVLERHNLSNPQAVSLLTSRALTYSGRDFSMRKTVDTFVSQGIKISRVSATAALNYLEDAFLIHKITDYSRALSSSPASTYKIYAEDPGLVYANSSASSNDIAQRLETAIYLELRRRAFTSRNNSVSSLHTRTHGYEIDFAVGDVIANSSLQLFQVSVHIDDEKTREREMRALEEAMHEYHTKESILLIHDGQREDVTTHDKTVIHIIPAWMWCLEGK